jgi:hypothetical protein
MLTTKEPAGQSREVGPYASYTRPMAREGQRKGGSSLGGLRQCMAAS